MTKKWIALFLSVLFLMLMGCQKAPAAAGAGASPAAPGSSASAPAYPTKTIEMVVPFSAGGGSDIFARTVVKIIMDNKMTDQTINVVNKTGGSGAIGYAYTAEHKGNPYYIAAVGSSFYASALIAQSPVSYKDFRPVGALADDTVGLFVRADSKYDNLQAILDDIKAAPSSLTVGGTGGTALDAIAYYMLQDRADVQFSYVPYDGGGEALTALLGGHVDLVFANPSEALAQLEAGKIRLLTVASGERIASFSDVPTFVEQGLDIELSQIRGFLLPKDAPDEAVAFWEELLKKVYDTDAFQKDYLETNMIIPRYLTADEYLKAFEDVTATYTEVFDQMGILKNRLD